MILLFWLMLPYDFSVFRLEKKAKTTKFFVRSKDFPPSHGGPPTLIGYTREWRLKFAFRFPCFPCLPWIKNEQSRLTDVLHVHSVHKVHTVHTVHTVHKTWYSEDIFD